MPSVSGICCLLTRFYFILNLGDLLSLNLSLGYILCLMQKCRLHGEFSSMFRLYDEFNDRFRLQGELYGKFRLHT